MNRITNFVAMGIGAVGLVSAIGGGVVLAQDSGSGTPTPSARSVEHQQRVTGYLDALAGNLGIDRATLDAALKKTGLAMVDKAVADGKITQTEADAIKARIEASAVPMIGPFGGMKGGHGGDRGGPRLGAAAPLSEIAAFLGIDEAALVAELRGGATLAEAALAHGKSRADIETFLTGNLTARIQAAQDAGTITAEQAQTLRDGVAAHVTGALDGGKGGHFEFKGPGGSHFRGHIDGAPKPSSRTAPAGAQAE